MKRGFIVALAAAAAFLLFVCAPAAAKDKGKKTEEDLLKGAYTEATHPKSGKLKSMVTAVRFHNGDKPSYKPHGLVRRITRREKSLNGVEWYEYSGEMSGTSWSGIEGPNGRPLRFDYGPIDADGVNHSKDNVAPQKMDGGLPVWLNIESDEVKLDPAQGWLKRNKSTGEWVAVGNPLDPIGPAPAEGYEQYNRKPLGGLPFILRVPKQGWNGVLVVYPFGGDRDSIAATDFSITSLDDILLLDEGYAYVALGIHSHVPFNSNPNLDEYWDSIDTLLQRRPLALPRLSSFQSHQYFVYSPSLYMDTTQVIKNILKKEFFDPERAYCYTYQLMGTATQAIVWGKVNDVSFKPNENYQGANVYDGVINHSPLCSNIRFEKIFYIRTNPKPSSTQPASDIPYVIAFSSNNQRSTLQFSATTLAKSVMAGNELNNFRAYMFENMAIAHASMFYASIKNSGSFSFDGKSINTDGKGEALTSYLTDRIVHGKVTPIVQAGLMYSLGGPSFQGFAHQMIENFEDFWEKGIPLPLSNLDPYLFKQGNSYWPKYPTKNSEGTMTDIVLTVTYDPCEYDTCEIEYVDYDTGKTYTGTVKDAVDYIVSQDVWKYRNKTLRLPEDTARTGLFYALTFFMFRYYTFTPEQMADGFTAADYRGQPVQMAGYGNKAGYVDAVKTACEELEAMRLWHPRFTRWLVRKAQQTKLFEK